MNKQIKDFIFFFLYHQPKPSISTNRTTGKWVVSQHQQNKNLTCSLIYFFFFFSFYKWLEFSSKLEPVVCYKSTESVTINMKCNQYKTSYWWSEDVDVASTAAAATAASLTIYDWWQQWWHTKMFQLSRASISQPVTAKYCYCKCSNTV